MTESKDYFVYILRNNYNKLYIGYSTNVDKRFNYHQKGKAAKFTKDLKNFELVYIEKFATRLGAMRREKQIKKWTRAKKEALIKGDFDLLKKL